MISTKQVRVTLADGQVFEVSREDIKAVLPYGALARISKSAEVERATVSDWFKGKFNSRRVEAAAVVVYAEELTRLQRMRNALTAALTPATAQQ